MDVRHDLARADRVTLARVLRDAGCETVRPDGPTGVATRCWNGALDPRPALVVRCATAGQAAAALRAATAASLPVSILGGGQDWAGRSLRDGSLVLDVSGMTTVAIDDLRREAAIGGGVTAGSLNRAAGRRGLAAVIGNDGAVGMAGLTLGGGYGPLMTRYGLACDNLLAAEVALPDGRIVACDAERETELFWALRGGGGNFGAVTAMRVRLHAPGPVLAGTVVLPWADAPAALGRFASLMARASTELFGSAILSTGPGGQPVAVVTLVWSGEPGRGEALVAEIASVGAPLVVKAEPMPADQLLSLTDGKLSRGRGYEVATRWFSDLAPEAVAVVVDGFGARTSPLSSVILHHCHGAAVEVAPGATAFGMRASHFTGLIYAAWDPAATGDAGPHRAWARKLAADLDRFALPGGYANLLPDDAGDRIAGAFGANAPRLARAKARYDPGGLLKGLPLPRA